MEPRLRGDDGAGFFATLVATVFVAFVAVFVATFLTTFFAAFFATFFTACFATFFTACFATFPGLPRMSRSTHVGAWSLAPGKPRTQRSTPAARRRGASSSLSSRWSMRRPASRGQWFRK